eukprot:9707453-Lingulodinium_polyedra.AAC.1
MRFLSNASLTEAPELNMHVLVRLRFGQHSTGKGASGAHGLRWGVLSPSSRAACQKALEMVQATIATYPDLRDGEYFRWQQCLERYLMPASA